MSWIRLLKPHIKNIRQESDDEVKCAIKAEAFLTQVLCIRTFLQILQTISKKSVFIVKLEDKL